MSYPNPTTSRHKPLEGKGCFNTEIHFKSILLGSDDAFVVRNLFYEFIETVNGLEVFIENPDVQNATALLEDVRDSLKDELKYQIENLGQYNLIIHFYQIDK